MSWKVRLTHKVHAVVGIIQQQGKLLIAERPQGKPYAGYWEFPGGKIEPNETAEAALIRELHEELGIEVSQLKFLFTHQHQYPDKLVTLEIFLVQSFNGEIQRLEHAQILWKALEEITAIPFLEGNWPIIQQLKNFLSES